MSINTGAPTGATVELVVRGMTCEACERHVGTALEAVPGVLRVEVRRTEGSARVWWGSAVPDAGALVDAVRRAGYDAVVRRVAGSPDGSPVPGLACCECCKEPA